MEELLKALNENKELSEKVKKLWQEKASAADIVAVLKEAGHDVDISVVEEALKKTQDDLAKKVAMEKLNDEALATVAGGGSGVDCTAVDDCDNLFTYCTTVTTTERCEYAGTCDEFFM